MVEQLDKKNASPKKLTAQQLKNEELKEVIVDFLADNEDKGFTVTDLIKAIPEFEGDSNQHVSALMRQLVNADKVEKYSEKRRTYFRIVAEG
jgi:predicted transcriptional regulator